MEGNKIVWPRVIWLWVILGLIIFNLVCWSVACGPAHAADHPGSSGLASYYTVKSCQREGTSGVWTASGERYDEGAFTCALPWKPDGAEYMVYSHQTGRSVVVRHNDRGPGRGPQAKGVVIDLTPAAWKALGFSTLDGQGNGPRRGHIEVSYQRVY